MWQEMVEIGVLRSLVLARGACAWSGTHTGAFLVRCDVLYLRWLGHLPPPWTGFHPALVQIGMLHCHIFQVKEKAKQIPRAIGKPTVVYAQYHMPPPQKQQTRHHCFSPGCVLCWWEVGGGWRAMGCCWV